MLHDATYWKRSASSIFAYLDPNFEYPDLEALAESMVAGTIRIDEAFALARKIMRGEIRQTSVGKARVIGPHGRGMKV